MRYLSTFLYFNKIILELTFWAYLFPTPAPPRSKPGLGFNPPANRSPKPKDFFMEKSKKSKFQEILRIKQIY